MLFSTGAQLDAEDNDKRTALYQSVCFGQEDTTEMLIERGADVLHEDSLRRTVFHTAAASGQISVLGLLVESLEEIEIVYTMLDNDSYTPVHVAALSGHAGCVEYLIQKMTTFEGKQNQFSPAHCAV